MYKFYINDLACCNRRILMRTWLMRINLTCIIVLLAFLNVAFAAKAQKIHLSYKNASIQTVFDEIRLQSGYDFVYPKSLLRKAKPVKIDVQDMELKDVLQQLFAQQPFSYSIETQTIVVREKEPTILEKIDDFFTLPINIKGKVVDEQGQPLIGASIRVKGGNQSTTTDGNGNFVLNGVAEDAVLIISYVGYEAKEVAAKADLKEIVLEHTQAELEEVEIVSTGYQSLPKERATGSFEFVDNETINRSIAPNILDRLVGVTNGFLADRNAGNTLGISVRGRSTLFSNTAPLIVVDNFPYEASSSTLIKNLNPNDIESITVLKDAAAASIWGAKAGNGVIVITTKSGRLNKPLTVSFTGTTSISDKIDFDYRKRLSSMEFIEMEEFLFNKGYYNSTINNGYARISPIVQMLYDRRRGLISSADSLRIAQDLAGKDVMDDYAKYFYRKAIDQQYQINFSGGGNAHTYYASFGYDKQMPSERQISDDRFTVKVNNEFNFLKNRLLLDTDLTFSLANNSNDYVDGYNPIFPYETLVDDVGNPKEALRGGSGLRSAYTDTAGAGYLLDWKFRPIEELNNKYSTHKGKVQGYLANLRLSYRIMNGLTAALFYQYNKVLTNGYSYHDPRSYHVRDIVNTYSQIDFTTGEVFRPIQIGGIMRTTSNDFVSQSGRFQLNYDKSIGDHNINAIAGYEANKQDNLLVQPATYYGYDPKYETFQLVDYTTRYPKYFGSSIGNIGNSSYRANTVDRTISYYGNLGYSYKNKYLFTTSFRKDQANIFGVKTNQKGVPLWSVGVGWNLHEELFYKFEHFPYLKLRGTYGFNGNVNKSVTALLTARNKGINVYLDPFYEIVSPPNPSLRWERVENINFGVDFEYGESKQISGSIEYYIKNGMDLMATSPITPQTGMVEIYGNVANTSTKGIDLKLTSKNISLNQFSWISTLIFNYSKDKVVNYFVQPGVNSDIVRTSLGIVPFEGYPINTLISYKYGGLNDKGDPQGYLDGELSTDYRSIQQSLDLALLNFNGSKVPPIFGSLMNSFTYEGFELSFNLTYKFGNHFMRNSLTSIDLFRTGKWYIPDYGDRWKVPGDELVTTVPSLVYPVNVNRDTFYEKTEVLVEKGDQIRFRDVRLSYQFKRTTLSMLNEASIFIYANNLGIVWRANKRGLDPDVLAGYPSPKTISLGLSIKL